MQNTKQVRQLFEHFLRENSIDRPPSELYEPVNYIMGLGGKRMRPALLLLSYQLFKADIEKAFPAALAVETFHNFTLVHDDIMDAAPLRRGQPTVHTKYNMETGILSGDVMLLYAYEYLMMIENRAIIPELIRVFNEVAIEVCEGQQFDMNFEKRDDVQLPEYLLMIERKTAALISGALQLGALIAGAPITDLDHLDQFGRNIGIAFQLQDDILDTFGNPEKFGKKTGGDIAQNKKTFLYLKAQEMANLSQMEELNRLLNDGRIGEEEKIRGVTRIFRNLDIQGIAENTKKEYLEKAFQHLKLVEVDEDRKQPIYEMAEGLIVREV